MLSSSSLSFRGRFVCVCFAIGNSLVSENRAKSTCFANSQTISSQTFSSHEFFYEYIYYHHHHHHFFLSTPPPSINNNNLTCLIPGTTKAPKHHNRFRSCRSGLKILAKKDIGMNEKLKNSNIFYVACSPPLSESERERVKTSAISLGKKRRKSSFTPLFHLQRAYHPKPNQLNLGHPFFCWCLSAYLQVLPSTKQM